MAKLKNDCHALKKAIEMMEKELTESMLLAEFKMDVSYLTKIISLKRRRHEKENKNLRRRICFNVIKKRGNCHVNIAQKMKKSLMENSFCVQCNV